MSTTSTTAIEQLLQELELELVQPMVRKNAARLSLLLADEFREFGSSGRIFSKSDIIEALQTESPVQFSISDFRAKVLGDGAALVTYRVVQRAGAKEVVSLRSSLWVIRDSQWQILFHQGTKVEN